MGEGRGEEGERSSYFSEKEGGEEAHHLARGKVPAKASEQEKKEGEKRRRRGPLSLSFVE